jgi:hypothetical protein
MTFSAASHKLFDLLCRGQLRAEPDRPAAYLVEGPSGAEPRSYAVVPFVFEPALRPLRYGTARKGSGRAAR